MSVSGKTTSVIVLGVLFAISLLVIIGLVIYIVVLKRNAADKTGTECYSPFDAHCCHTGNG